MAGRELAVGAKIVTARIVIAGGSGFIGLSLARHLAGETAGDIVILSRSPPSESGPWRHAEWDGRTLGPWQAEVDGAAALVNLAGRTVNCVKTPDHCDEILRSRLEATAVLGQACRTARQPPPVWVQMATAHIYGDPPSAVCDEGSPFGLGLAPTVGRAWEAAFADAKLANQRGVVLRTSFVIGKPHRGGAGALGPLAGLARWGLGGRVGSGTQGLSWLHERDMNRIIARAIADSTMAGAYIATAPQPVSQLQFMAAVRRHAGGLGGLGLALPSPAWVVRLGATLVLRTDPELVLYGRYLVPKRLIDEGFHFDFAEIGAAMADLLG